MALCLTEAQLSFSRTRAVRRIGGLGTWIEGRRSRWCLLFGRQVDVSRSCSGSVCFISFDGEEITEGEFVSASVVRGDAVVEDEEDAAGEGRVAADSIT